MSHINIEIKAKCSNHDKIRWILKSNNADYKGIDHQIDTYFNVTKGRLKLRKGNIENSLIWYSRRDTKGPKQSNILLNENPTTSIEKILRSALNTTIIVDKIREIYFIENVKFHLDKVEGLGDFVEIEAIDLNEKIGREKLCGQCSHYVNLFETKKEDFIAGSYSDLLKEFLV
jgi:predicted adenylyl cyclase CyaB